MGTGIASEIYKKKIVVWLVYVAVLVALEVLGSGVNGLVRLGNLLFVVGGFVGLLTPWVDRLIYVYFSKPQEPLSVEVKQKIAVKQYKEAMAVLRSRADEQKHLAMNNILFLGVWVVLAVFMVTSSRSYLAKGAVLGIGLDLVLGLTEGWQNQARLKERLFWPLKRDLRDQEFKALVGIFVGAFVMLSFLVL